VKLRGLAKVDWLFVFSCAAHNLIRLPKLLAQQDTEMLGSSAPERRLRVQNGSPDPTSPLAKHLTPHNQDFYTPSSPSRKAISTSS